MDRIKQNLENLPLEVLLIYLNFIFCMITFIYSKKYADLRVCLTTNLLSVID